MHTEIITNHCHVANSGLALACIMQLVYPYRLKPSERDNHFVSFTPDDTDKQNESLVAIFRIKNLKIKPNVSNNI